MSEIEVQEASLKPLLAKMVAAKQLSSTDAELLLRQSQTGAQQPLQGEADVLRWLAQEYDLTYTTLEDIELDRQLISLFPARILLKEELLPLRRVNGSVEVSPPPASRSASSVSRCAATRTRPMTTVITRNVREPQSLTRP